MINPLVSIITPSYNRGHLIEDTIKSVLDQTYENIEYIVVDGLSTDNTVEILVKYSKEGQLHYISENDEGMYYAINKGIKMARGDIIAYLNSDDRYFPWSVQKAVESFQEHGTIDMIFGDSYVVDIPSNKTHFNIYASYREYWLPLGGVICQPTVFLRRRVFEEVGFFNTEFKYLADCEFWHRVSNSKNMNILKIDEFMAIEYNHAETIRHEFQEDIKMELEKISHLFGKEYNLKKLRQLILWIFREMKLWKLILIDRTKKIKQYESWSNYLKFNDVEFNIMDYFLRKPFRMYTFVKNWLNGDGII
jgi:glycosyltransferase involved in cell wall biosynthesis